MEFMSNQNNRGTRIWPFEIFYFPNMHFVSYKTNTDLGDDHQFPNNCVILIIILD